MKINLSFSALSHLVLAVAIALLVSCNKDDQSPTQCEITSFTNSNKQVVALIYQDSSAQLSRVDLLDSTGKLIIGYALVTYNEKKQINRLTYYTSIGLLNDSIISFDYNADGSLNKKYRYKRHTAGDSVLIRYEQLTYDPATQQVTEKLTFRKDDAPQSTERYQLHTYEYNVQGNITTETFYPTSDAMRSKTKSDTNVVVTAYTYDSKLNPLHKTYFFTGITPLQFSQNNILQHAKQNDKIRVLWTYGYNNTGYPYAVTIANTIKKKAPNQDEDSTLSSTKRNFTYLCK